MFPAGLAIEADGDGTKNKEKDYFLLKFRGPPKTALHNFGRAGPPPSRMEMQGPGKILVRALGVHTPTAAWGAGTS